MAAKEYGERVDRMCWELEVIGLPDPSYNNDTFILKATVKSASIGRESTQNASIQQNDASIQQNDTMIENKDLLLYKVNQLADARKISFRDVEDARTIIASVDISQVITANDVMTVLKCQTTKARQDLRELEKWEIIIKVQGKGKGKFILNIPGY